MEEIKSKINELEKERLELIKKMEEVFDGFMEGGNNPGVAFNIKDIIGVALARYNEISQEGRVINYTGMGRYGNLFKSLKKDNKNVIELVSDNGKEVPEHLKEIYDILMNIQVPRDSQGKIQFLEFMSNMIGILKSDLENGKGISITNFEDGKKVKKDSQDRKTKTINDIYELVQNSVNSTLDQMNAIQGKIDAIDILIQELTHDLTQRKYAEAEERCGKETAISREKKAEKARVKAEEEINSELSPYGIESIEELSLNDVIKYFAETRGMRENELVEKCRKLLLQRYVIDPFDIELTLSTCKDRVEMDEIIKGLKEIQLFKKCEEGIFDTYTSEDLAKLANNANNRKKVVRAVVDLLRGN